MAAHWADSVVFVAETGGALRNSTAPRVAVHVSDGTESGTAELFGGDGLVSAAPRSLVAYGDAHGGPTAMAKSVGLTAAVGVHRLMEPEVASSGRLAGVLRPTEKQIWEYCLPRLEVEGLRFRESHV